MAKYVNFIEVGPRDGFQNVKEYIPVDTKNLRIIDDLINAGVSAWKWRPLYRQRLFRRCATVCGGRSEDTGQAR